MAPRVPPPQPEVWETKVPVPTMVALRLAAVGCATLMAEAVPVPVTSQGVAPAVPWLAVTVEAPVRTAAQPPPGRPVPVVTLRVVVEAEVRAAMSTLAPMAKVAQQLG